MTPDLVLNVDDYFIPEEFLPQSLRKLAKKSPVPFPGTINLMSYFKHLLTMDEKAGKQAVAMFYRCFQHYYEQIARGPDGYEKALAITEAMEETLKEDAKRYPDVYGKVTCSRGCNHCCSQRVTVTKLEFTAMHSHIKRLGLKLDLARAKAQSSKNVGDYDRLPLEDQRCLMLDEDGSCRVYQWRPLSCRKYQVVSPPEMCNKQAHTHAHIVFNLQAEALTGAVFTYDSPHVELDRGLADQLLRNIPETSNLWVKNEKSNWADP